MGIGLHNIQPGDGAKHRKKRIGRGIGSGQGKTSGRGHKGNKARGQVNPNFEGGQTPLHRRLPQIRGVRSRNPFGFKQMRDRSYAIVNLGTLQEHFEPGAEITPEALVEKGLLRVAEYGLRPGQQRVKILADGTLTKKFTVRAHRFSASAEEQIKALGGKAELLTA
jgi:large subunit ribosomal protein L15